MLLLVDAIYVALFCIFLAWITAAQLAERTNQFMVSIDISKSLRLLDRLRGVRGHELLRRSCSFIRRLRGREVRRPFTAADTRLTGAPMLVAVLLISLLVFIAIGVPIAIALAGSSLLYIVIAI